MGNKEKISLQEMFQQYAKQEIEFVKSADPNKLYCRILPNLKEKDRGYIDFLFKKIIIGGYIEKDTICLNKLKVTKDGDEKDIDEALAKVKETINKGDMKLVDNINL